MSHLSTETDYLLMYRVLDLSKIWIGAQYYSELDSIVDTNDDLTVLYSAPWAPNEPSGSGCVVYSSGKGGWDSTSCSSNQPFACIAPIRTGRAVNLPKSYCMKIWVVFVNVSMLI